MKCLALALLPCLASALLAGQDQTSPAVSAGRVTTKTRLVAMFEDFETQMLKAEQARDEQTLNRLLADEFEVWTPELSGEPIPRNDWQKQVMARKLTSFRFDQMVVKALSDEIVVASFLLTQSTPHGDTRNHFVVDVWKKNGDSWQLTDRYSSRVKAAGTQTSRTQTKANKKE